MTGRSLPAGELFGIDVGAEVETLSTRQLQGAWQVPAELVRDAVRRGARAVAVRTQRGSVEVLAEGVALPPEELDLLAATFDAGCAAADRHRAVVALERAGANALLWAGGSGSARVEVATSAGGGRVLSRGAGQAPRVGPWVSTSACPESRVRLEGARFDLGQSVDWLGAACRFAPVPVEVNGTRLEPRFPGGLLRARLERPLPGLLSVAATGEAPLLWLLQHGVVSTRATVPGYPAFQAAVELGGRVPGPASPSALREAVAPHLVELVDQTIGMLLRAAEGLDRLPPATARRVVLLLLEAAELGLRRGEVLGCPLLPTAGDGRRRWSLDQVRAAADRGLAPWVVDEALDTARIAFGLRGALRLGREERGLVRDLIGVGLEAAPHRSGGGWSEVGRWVRALRGFPWPPWGVGRPVPWGELSSEERGLARALSGRLLGRDGKAVSIRMTGGAGRPRRVGQGLDLPRGNPEVRGWVARHAADPRWLYPVALAIAGEDLEPAPELRRRWLELQGVGETCPGRLVAADSLSAGPVGDLR